MCRRLHRHGADLPRLDRGTQARLDQAEAVGVADLPPALPAEDRGGVVQGDLAQLRLLALLEESLDPRLHRRQGTVQIRVEDDAGDALGRFRLDPVVDRLEQARLVAVVVVEGTAGDAGRPHDLLGADVVVAALGEELPRRGEQRLSGRFRAFSLSTSFPGFWTYVHAVCMLPAMTGQRRAS